MYISLRASVLAHRSNRDVTNHNRQALLHFLSTVQQSCAGITTFIRIQIRCCPATSYELHQAFITIFRL